MRNRTRQLYEPRALDIPDASDMLQYTAERVFWHHCFVTKQYGNFTGNPGPFTGLRPPTPSVDSTNPHYIIALVGDRAPAPSSLNLTGVNPTVRDRRLHAPSTLLTSTTNSADSNRSRHHDPCGPDKNTRPSIDS